MNADKPERKVTQLPDEHDRQLSALYGQTDAEAPSGDTDRRILAAACEAAALAAMRSKPVLARRRVPLSVAAILLVLLGLVPLWMWKMRPLPDAGTDPAAPPPAGLSVDGDAATESPVPPEAPGSAAPMSQPVPPEAAPVPEAEATPEQQGLEEILTLITTGRDVEAWQRFSEFRRAYPDHRIPDALLDELAGVRARLLERADGQ